VSATAVSVDRESRVPLSAQIENAFRRGIATQSLQHGTKLPSVRALAARTGVSAPTVVEAYNRLVATGDIEARRGSGFYVARRAPAVPVPKEPVSALPVDSMWLLSRVYEETPFEIQAGCGWLPEQWLDAAGLRSALRTVSRSSGAHLTRYGNPNGYRPLRRLLQQQLCDRGIEAGSDQIVLTQGASQALHLVVELLVRPGDAVAVDDPGYCNLISLLRHKGLRVVGIPRTPTGPDLEALARAAASQPIKAFFTNTQLQNPTGTSYSSSARHRTVRLAEEHDFHIVEDDIFADLLPRAEASLASLDGLNRVIHIQSFSKTISPSLRVGYLVCSRALAEDVLHIKMLNGLTTSELNERIAYSVLTEGARRTHMNHLHDRLARAQAVVSGRLTECGLEVFHRPQAGMFIWAGFRRDCDAGAIASEAAQAGIVLAPSQLFRVDGRAEPWFRFNVAHSSHPKLFAFLERIARRFAP
jgi:DNA-binding transcriptional MocR family regulator